MVLTAKTTQTLRNFSTYYPVFIIYSFNKAASVVSCVKNYFRSQKYNRKQHLQRLCDNSVVFIAWASINVISHLSNLKPKQTETLNLVPGGNRKAVAQSHIQSSLCPSTDEKHSCFPMSSSQNTAHILSSYSFRTTFSFKTEGQSVLAFQWNYVFKYKYN